MKALWLQLWGRAKRPDKESFKLTLANASHSSSGIKLLQVQPIDPAKAGEPVSSWDEYLGIARPSIYRPDQSSGYKAAEQRLNAALKAGPLWFNVYKPSPRYGNAPAPPLTLVRRTGYRTRELADKSTNYGGVQSAAYRIKVTLK